MLQCQSHKLAAQETASVRRAQAHYSHPVRQRKEAGRQHDTFPQNGRPRGCIQKGLTTQPNGYETDSKAAVGQKGLGIPQKTMAATGLHCGTHKPTEALQNKGQRAQQPQLLRGVLRLLCWGSGGFPSESG